MSDLSLQISNEIIDDIITKIENEKFLIEKIKTIDEYKLFKLMYEISNMPSDNMSRMCVSKLLENVFAELIGGRYVGDKQEWETDIVFPFVENVIDNHLKLEVKSLKEMFLKNGDTNGIIIKNGRGSGQTIRSLLPSIKKNLFILIEKSDPFSISYVYSKDLLLYIGSKKTAKKIIDIEKDNDLLDKTAAELSAFVKKDDIHFIHKSINENFEKPELYNPKQEIINIFKKRHTQ